MLDIIGLISKYFRNIFSYLNNLFLFFYKPSKLFDIIQNESKNEYLARLILYMFILEFASISISSSITTKSPSLNIMTIVGFMCMELVFSFIPFPCFLLIAQFCKPKVPPRIIISYLVISKFIFNVINVIFFNLFILTENYTFAMIKGLVFNIGVFFIIIIFPLIFSNGFKKKSLLLFTTGVIVFIYFSLLGYLFTFINLEKNKLPPKESTNI